MKKKALHKDIKQEIRNTFTRFLSIFLMSALGVSFFSGVRASMPDMLSTTDRYLKESELFDLQVVSTMGLQEEDLEAVLDTDGVKDAELTYSSDLLCDRDGEQYAVHLMAESSMAECTVEEGRLPEEPDEIFLDSALAETLGCQIGDTVTFYESGSDEDSDPVLKSDDFVVTGIGSSPMYLSMSRGSTSVGNGQVSGFAVVMPEAFDLEVYTQMNIRLEDLGDLECYTDEYKELVSTVQKNVEASADGQCEWRYRQIYDDASEQLADARTELDDAKRTADQELADARKKLDDGWSQVRDGETQLADGKKTIADGELQIAENRSELESARVQLEEARAQAADGEFQLADARAKLTENENQLVMAEEELNGSRTQLEQAEAALSEGRAQLEAGEAQLEASRQELESRREELEAAGSQLEAGEAELAAQEQQFAQAEAEFEAQKTQLEEQIVLLQSQLDSMTPGTSEYEETAGQIAGLQDAIAQGSAALEENRQKLEAARSELEANAQQIESALAQLAAYDEQLSAGELELEQQREVLEANERELQTAREQFDAAEPGALAQIADGRSQLQAAGVLLDEKAAELAAGMSQILSSEQQLADGESQLASAVQQLTEAKAQLPSQEQKLVDARKELEDGEKEYEDGRREAQEKIADGESQLMDAQKELDELETPKWYVRDRSDVVEDYSAMEDNASQIGAIGKVFPLMFFLVAALVSLTTMTRMVEEQRGHIGTMKALGYSKSDIAMKYLWYAGSATLGGGILGILIGQKLFPYIIQVSYGIMYECLKKPDIPYRMSSALQALGISFACIMAATASACLKELRQVPAELMRPEAPKVGKRVLLEYVPFIWKRLNFTTKSTFRNLFRYKKRLFMTVFGISATMALIVTGFGLRDSIIDLAEIQYDNIQLYDAMVTLNGTDEEKEAADAWVQERKEVKASTMVHMLLMDAETDSGSGEVYLCIPENADEFQAMTVLKNRTSEEVYELDDDGILLTEWMSDTLDVKEGDTITLQEDEGDPVEVKVSGIVENYIMNYVYMTPGLYEKLYGETPEYEVMYVEMTEQGLENERDFGSKLLEKPGVYNVSYTSDQKSEINDMLQALVMVVIVLIITAALLAYVVLYNLNSVNITERRRELATLKVLGFYDQEVAAYVYHENIILTLIGIVAGVFLGIILHQYIIHTIRVDMVMFGQKVAILSFVISGLLTAAFSAFVNFVMYFKLKEINMVESLKSVE